jgi:hypothetical protein
MLLAPLKPRKTRALPAIVKESNKSTRKKRSSTKFCDAYMDSVADPNKGSNKDKIIVIDQDTLDKAMSGRPIRASDVKDDNGEIKKFCAE